VDYKAAEDGGGKGEHQPDITLLQLEALSRGLPCWGSGAGLKETWEGCCLGETGNQENTRARQAWDLEVYGGHYMGT